VWKRFFAFLGSPVVRRLTLLVVVIALLYWWGAVVWERLVTLFGFGLIIIAIALGVAIWVVWRGQFRTVGKRWNCFVGGTMVALAVWGILSFFGLGGIFGQGIIGTSTTLGLLVIAGLLVVGIIFVAPRKAWRVATRTSRRVWRFLTGLPRPRPALVHSRPTPQATPPEASDLSAASRSSERSEEEAKQPGFAKRAAVPEPKYEVGKHGPILTASGWQIPAIDILDKPTEAKLDQHDIERRAELIEEALASYGVEGKVVQINTGPTVTQFGVEPGWDRRYKEIKERGKNGNTQVRLEEVSRLLLFKGSKLCRAWLLRWAKVPVAIPWQPIWPKCPTCLSLELLVAARLFVLIPSSLACSYIIALKMSSLSWLTLSGWSWLLSTVYLI